MNPGPGFEEPRWKTHARTPSWIWKLSGSHSVRRGRNERVDDGGNALRSSGNLNTARRARAHSDSPFQPQPLIDQRHPPYTMHQQIRNKEGRSIDRKSRGQADAHLRTELLSANRLYAALAADSAYEPVTCIGNKN